MMLLPAPSAIVALIFTVVPEDTPVPFATAVMLTKPDVSPGNSLKPSEARVPVKVVPPVRVKVSIFGPNPFVNAGPALHMPVMALPLSTTVPAEESRV